MMNRRRHLLLACTSLAMTSELLLSGPAFAQKNTKVATKGAAKGTANGAAKGAAKAVTTDSSADTAAEDMKDRLRFGWLGRSDVQEFISDVASRNELPRNWVELQFKGLGLQPRALALMNPPPPKPNDPVRKRSWARYLSQHADTSRIQEGRAFMETHRTVLDDVAKNSGVPASVITAILGVETKYGKITGRYPTLETLTTLAFESPRRADFFRRELEALLLMGYDGTINLREAKGSFAGALGFPQFMPSSWQNFALGYQNPKQADLINNPHDAIASIGNFLKRHGWRANTPSHIVAEIPRGLDVRQFVAPKLEPIHTVSELEAAGIRQRANRLHASTRASLIDLPEEDDTAQYWIAAHNFFVVTQYNRSFMYAAAVLTLAESLNDSTG
jgi:membrane-bound lytic murein transglycosylase B